MTELLPCPFCGGTQTSVGEDILAWDEAAGIYRSRGWRVVHDCVGAPQVTLRLRGVTREQAIDRWLFETMIFGPSERGEWQERTSTLEEARATHARAIEKLRSSSQKTRPRPLDRSLLYCRM